MNDFEQRLRQVPVKPVPPDWRAGILAAARAEQVAGLPRERAHAQPLFIRLQARLYDLFWPHPKAWAGLAAVWLLILGLHFSERDEPSVHAGISAPPTPETLAELRQQQLLLTELLGPPPITEADRAHPKPGQPRTRYARIFMV